MEKLIPKNKQRLFYIKWHDAHSCNGWLTKKQIEEKIGQEAFFCEEVGWIVYEDSKEIHLVARRGCWNALDGEVDSEYGLYQRIPKTWVLKRKEIRIK